MTSRNIFAFTAFNQPIYPEYISVNYPFDGSGGGQFTSTETIEVSVRSPAVDGACGSLSKVSLDRRQARELGLALIQATNR